MTNSQAWDYAIGMIYNNAFFSDRTDFSKKEYLQKIVYDALDK